MKSLEEVFNVASSMAWELRYFIICGMAVCLIIGLIFIVYKFVSLCKDVPKAQKMDEFYAKIRR